MLLYGRIGWTMLKGLVAAHRSLSLSLFASHFFCTKSVFNWKMNRQIERKDVFNEIYCVVRTRELIIILLWSWWKDDGIVLLPFDISLLRRQREVHSTFFILKFRTLNEQIVECRTILLSLDPWCVGMRWRLCVCAFRRIVRVMDEREWEWEETRR